MPNGNVASRVLPVQIHGLNANDIALCESVLSENLRSVDLIYKEQGVNRPLTHNDDPKTNLNKTSYRNQINKVALAIREVISGLTDELSESTSESKETTEAKPAVKEKSIIVLP